MSRPPIYVTRPELPAIEEFIPSLERIWQSRVLTNSGPFHQALERALEAHLRISNLSLFTNGTVALITALQALELSGEVITTPYSFVATANAIRWNRLEPVFVDVEPGTLNLDPSRIEAAITSRTTAILPVHCYGGPCAVDRIQEIARGRNLRVVYDAAHAFGVELDGASVLGYGDISVLSFHATKVFNTFEGGAIVSRDPDAKKRVDQLRNFGLVDEASVADAGMNGKMSELHAAFGLLQLRRVEAALDARRKIDARYRQEFINVPGISCLPIAGGVRRNGSYFPIFVGEEYPISRDALFDVLKRNGIIARRYFYPLISDFDPYKTLASSARRNLPVAAAAADRVLCLPIYPTLEDEDLERIINIVADPDC